ncbi:hypothetical protein VNO77_41819 [Canavalia gladiata]|uniref:Uncharacterized protein n=1 Tax=Canavalia gladiata TaxID=3824 RepID=A0AAN9K194_CANGL
MSLQLQIIDVGSISLGGNCSYSILVIPCFPYATSSSHVPCSFSVRLPCTFSFLITFICIHFSLSLILFSFLCSTFLYHGLSLSFLCIPLLLTTYSPTSHHSQLHHHCSFSQLLISPRFGVAWDSNQSNQLPSSPSQLPDA